MCFKILSYTTAHPAHCCPSWTSCKPICFANSPPNCNTTHFVIEFSVQTERALLALISCSPELGDHLSARRLLHANLLHLTCGQHMSVASQIHCTFSHYHLLFGCTLKSLLVVLTDSFKCYCILWWATWFPLRAMLTTIKSWLAVPRI